MKYALVDGKKEEAISGARGFCVCCGAEMIAKCGNRNVKHWAHKSLKHCDTWWENETEWHRNWKSLFPKDWQEVVHYDFHTNEKHIADVKTDKGFVLEFQNSPISLNELQSRENFYKSMLWIINGEKFSKNFGIMDKLPDPKSNIAKDVRFFPIKNSKQYRYHFRISENMEYEKGFFVNIHGNEEIQKEVEDNYTGHHLFYWINPRHVWYQSNTHIFFDFGGHFLWKLIFNYDDLGLVCIKKVGKTFFIKKALGLL